jgi:hypothetical protein
MAFGRKSVLSQVRPLVVPSDPRTVIRKGTLGATTEAGEIVALQSDGKYDPAAASGVVLFAGIALQSGGDGDPVDVLRYGPCEVLIDATPGTAIYASDTAGEYSTTAGTKSFIIGYAETATILFVAPQPVALS